MNHHPMLQLQPLERRYIQGSEEKRYVRVWEDTCHGQRIYKAWHDEWRNRYVQLMSSCHCYALQQLWRVTKELKATCSEVDFFQKLLQA